MFFVLQMSFTADEVVNCAKDTFSFTMINKRRATFTASLPDATEKPDAFTVAVGVYIGIRALENVFKKKDNTPTEEMKKWHRFTRKAYTTGTAISEDFPSTLRAVLDVKREEGKKYDFAWLTKIARCGCIKTLDDLIESKPLQTRNGKGVVAHFNNIVVNNLVYYFFILCVLCVCVRIGVVFLYILLCVG